MKASQHNISLTFLTAFLLIATGSRVYAQFRPFDNSRTLAPWIYNPSASFSDEVQVYLGYDGRGSNSLTPQTLIGGLRVPLLYRGRDRRRPAAMVGLQYLKSMQDIINSSVVDGNFAYEVPLSKRVRAALGIGGGISTLRYNFGNLNYLDNNDPLIGSGINFFNIHLNSGLSVVLDDKFTISVSHPYLLKENKLNLREVIARMAYRAPVTKELAIRVGANLDTYNRNMIVGGDLRADWKQSFSVMAGADNFKFYSGLSVSMDYLTIGYTYGYNYSKLFSNFANNQVMVLISAPQRNGTMRR